MNDYSNTILARESINSSTTEKSDIVYTTSFYGNRIRFWVLLCLQFCSVLCFLFVFCQVIWNKRLRQNIHHHVILLLLLVSFLFVTIILSLTLAYMYTSQVYPASDMFCSFWNWFHYSVNIINLFLMGFASIERYWFIFHPKLTKSKGGRILFHYCPLLFCVVHPPAFFAGAILIYQCTSDYDYTQLLCKWPCYFYGTTWAKVDLFFNNYTPLLCIPIFCAVIYIRVFLQKRALKQQRFKWRRDKKLILQLWALSSLYLGMWMPIQITGLINLYWLPTFLLQAQIDYMYLFPYLIHILYPYVVVLSFHHEIVKHRQIAAV